MFQQSSLLILRREEEKNFFSIFLFTAYLLMVFCTQFYENMKLLPLSSISSANIKLPQQTSIVYRNQLILCI